MAETFLLSSLVIPGTYVRVRAEGLIGAGPVSTGNIGIVGTAQLLDDANAPVDIYGQTYTLGGYEDSKARLGRYDAFDGGNGTLNLNRGVELLYAGGARTIYARPLAPGAALADYTAAFNELGKENVNIFVAPELPTADALSVFGSVLETQENNQKDIIAVVGADATTPATITGQVADDRIILAAPAIIAGETFEQGGATTSGRVTLQGRYTAAVIAGLLSTLAPQFSPTNKQVRGILGLSQRFSYSETIDLINGGVLVIEERLGFRVVRGVSSENATNGPFRQITTRRIVDAAKAGIRQASNPFIGRLNNQRVRAALRGAIDGFLTSMVQDEALIGYTLEVTATRDDEINGRAIVNVILQPTFSIDFIAVTLVLE